MWRRRSMLVVALVVSGLVVPVMAGEGQEGVGQEREGRRPEVPRMSAERLGNSVGMLLTAAASLPAAQEALEKYRTAAEALERQLGQLRERCMQEIRQATQQGATEDAVKQIAEKYRGEMLPIVEQLNAARRALCADLLKVAEAEPQAVAAATTNILIERIPRMREGASREGRESLRERREGGEPVRERREGGERERREGAEQERREGGDAAR